MRRKCGTICTWQDWVPNTSNLSWTPVMESDWVKQWGHLYCPRVYTILTYPTAAMVNSPFLCAVNATEPDNWNCRLSEVTDVTTTRNALLQNGCCTKEGRWNARSVGTCKNNYDLLKNNITSEVVELKKPTRETFLSSILTRSPKMPKPNNWRLSLKPSITCSFATNRLWNLTCSIPICTDTRWRWYRQRRHFIEFVISFK